jgi:hypothetical protein
MLAACSSPTYTTLQIQISGAELATTPALVSHTCYAVAYAPGGVLGVSTVLASASVVLASAVDHQLILLDPATGEAWQGEWGEAYDLYVWVDVNDNYPTPNTPESAADYQGQPFPFGSFVLGSECSNPDPCNGAEVTGFLIAP